MHKSTQAHGSVPSGGVNIVGYKWFDGFDDFHAMLKKDRMPPNLISKYYFDADMVHFTDYDGKMKTFVEEVDAVYTQWVEDSKANRSSSSSSVPKNATNDLNALRQEKAKSIMNKARTGKEASQEKRTMKRTVSLD